MKRKLITMIVLATFVFTALVIPAMCQHLGGA
jgi:hypothetical protein